MLDRDNLLTLMKVTALAKPSSTAAYSYEGKNYSSDALNETFLFCKHAINNAIINITTIGIL